MSNEIILNIQVLRKSFLTFCIRVKKNYLKNKCLISMIN